jgi:predicted metal-dependent hydrolase
MDLIPLSVDKRVSLDRNRKAQVMKTLHESVRQHIEKRNHVYANKTNKGCKHVVFQPSNCVWVHMRKERFLALEKSKLQP